MKLKIYNTIIWSLCLFLFVGFIFVGQNEILCVADDGRMKFETECLPCCNETEGVCKFNVTDHIHDEQDDSSDCSDLTIDGTLWSKRLNKVLVQNSVELDMTPTFLNNLILTPLNNIVLQSNNSLLTFYKAPQSVSIAVTVVRC